MAFEWLYREKARPDSHDYDALISRDSIALEEQSPPPFPREPLAAEQDRSSYGRKDISSRRLVLLAFAAGIVCSSVFFAVLQAGREVRVAARLQAERDWSRQKSELYDDLLTHNTPALSIYDGLRNDLRYLMMDSWSGETGQVLTTFSLLYLAQQTQRVAIIASPWHDNEHYPGSSVSFAEIYDLDRFRKETGSLFIMLDQVKKYDPKGRSTVKDDLGCFHGSSFLESGNTFGDFHFSLSNWRVPRMEGWAENSVEAFLLFDADRDYRLQQTRLVANETNRSIPRNMKDSQLICYDNLWSLSKVGVMAGEADPRMGRYLSFEGLQREKGGMWDLLAPEMRGKHPEWFAVGQYMDFRPEIWEVALFAVRKTLGVVDIPEDIVTVHLRRGDFLTWCREGMECVPQTDAYKAKVDELLKNLPKGTPVLATTDDTSPEFLSSLTALGWSAIDHTTLGTRALLDSRYGKIASGWFDAAVDQAIHSLGTAFVGTADSQVSLIGALRVATWNGGEIRIVARPGGW
ncbi:hypothetical protein JCM8547_000392 [Rhodosporidiobolus lusitaniae]